MHTGFTVSFTKNHFSFLPNVGSFEIINIWGGCVGAKIIKFDFQKKPAIHSDSIDGIITRAFSQKESVELPAVLGRGSIRNRVIHDGIILMTQSFKLKTPLILDIANSPRHIDLHFCLSGKMTVSSFFNGEDLTTHPNHRGFFNHASKRTVFKYMAGQHYRSVTITFSPDYLRSYLNCFSQSNPPDAILASLDTAESTIEKGLITPEMNLILHRLSSSQLKGLARDIYFEGKVLELVALHIERSAMEKCTHKRPAALQEQDIERIHKAETVLFSDIQDPPSLKELSRRVGLNDFKLKIGFRYVFGETVFGHLNRHRMDIARKMLMEQDMTILDVANSVGYSNPSHFAASFRKRFGVNPGSFRLNAS